MTNSKATMKKIDFSFFAKDKFLVIGAGIYIVLATIFSCIEFHYISMLDDPKVFLKNVSLTYIIIAVAAMIFPLILVKKKKILLAVITAVAGLLLTALSLYLLISPVLIVEYFAFLPDMFLWRATMILPFVLFIPYVVYIIKRTRGNSADGIKSREHD